MIRAKTPLKITSLDLSNKGLTEIPNEIFDCLNLKKLFLSNNNLTQIPKKIDLLSKLEILDISKNNLKQLHAGLFNLKYLKTLVLSRNQIKSIPKQIKDLKYLKILILNHNKIKDIGGICILPNLIRIDISNNEIESFKWLHNCSSVEDLWLSNNPAKDFSIQDIKTLQKKKLKRCFIFSNSDVPNASNQEYVKYSKIKGNILKSRGYQNLILQPKIENMPNVNIIKKKPLQIFISYSHADRKWLDRLKTHLRVLEKEGLVFDLWDDTRLRTGDNWKHEIEQSLNNSSIAILLVSTDFLASDFVRKEEIPALLKNAFDKGTKILPMVVSPCRFLKTVEISIYQSVNPPNQSLAKCSEVEQEEFFIKLMDDIEDYIR